MAGEDPILRFESGKTTTASLEDNLHVYSGTGLAVGDAVYLSAADTVALADADDSGKIPPIGVVTAVDGSSITVCHSGGTVTFGSAVLTAGSTYWLSTNGTTGNTLVATKPGSNAYIIGVALTTSKLLVTCLPGDLSIDALSLNHDNVLYLGKHGSDSNDGRTPDTAYLTLNAGITALNAESPSTSDRWVLVILDAGTYSSTVSSNLNNYASIYGPNATVNLGTSVLALDAGCHVKLHSISGAASQMINFSGSSGGEVWFSVDELTNSSASAGSIFGESTSGFTAHIDIKRLESTGNMGLLRHNLGTTTWYVNLGEATFSGTGDVLSMTDGAGDGSEARTVHFTANRITLAGAANFLDAASDDHTFFFNIKELTGASATAFDIQGSSVNDISVYAFIEKLDVGTIYESPITGYGNLYLYGNEISGTEPSLTANTYTYRKTTSGAGQFLGANHNKIIYVAAHGNNINDGRSPDRPKATFVGGSGSAPDAVTAVAALSPTATSRAAIVVLDDAVYSSGLTINLPDNTDIFAPYATIEATGLAGQAININPTASPSHHHIKVKKLLASGAGSTTCLSAEINGGVLPGSIIVIDIDEATCTSATPGESVYFNASGLGIIKAKFGLIHCLNDTALQCQSLSSLASMDIDVGKAQGNENVSPVMVFGGTGGKINLRAGRITGGADYGILSGFDGDLNIDVGDIDTTPGSIEVLDGDTINGYVGKLTSNYDTNTSGTLNIFVGDKGSATDAGTGTDRVLDLAFFDSVLFGTGVADRIPYYTGTNTLSTTSGFEWDGTNFSLPTTADIIWGAGTTPSIFIQGTSPDTRLNLNTERYLSLRDSGVEWMLWDGNTNTMTFNEVGSNATIANTSGSIILNPSLNNDVIIQDGGSTWLTLDSSTQRMLITGAGEIEASGNLTLESTGGNIILDTNTSGDVIISDNSTYAIFDGLKEGLFINSDTAPVTTGASALHVHDDIQSTAVGNIPVCFTNGNTGTTGMRIMRTGFAATTVSASSVRHIIFMSGVGTNGQSLGTLEGYIRGDGLYVNSFTGMHPAVYEVPSAGENLTDYLKEGVIVSSTGTRWRDDSMEDTIPYITHEAVNGSKKVYGILSSNWNEQNDMGWYNGTSTATGKDFHPDCEAEHTTVNSNLTWNGTTTIITSDTSELLVGDKIRYLDYTKKWFEITAINEDVDVTITNPNSYPIPTGSGAGSSEKMEATDDNSYAANGVLFKAVVNFTGDGKIWITDANGELQNGDLVELSDVVDENGIYGYGRKQADDIRRSSTVAKIVEDINWTTDATTFTPTSGGPGGNLKKILVGCTYLLG